MSDGVAWFDGWLATGVLDVTSDVSAVDSPGWWAVVVSFEGVASCIRFEKVRRAPAPGGVWSGVPVSDWVSSMQQREYVAACEATRQHIAAGTVYQVNICRVLSAPVGGAVLEPAGLHSILRVGNPAPYAGFIDAAGVRVVSASPELYLAQSGGVVSSGPIKGTGKVPEDLQGKDEAENVMIVDLVRNDLSHVCDPGSVAVPDFLTVEEHPGLVHLVSTVSGRVSAGVPFSEVLGQTFPPGSVSGAPKSTALQIISELEPTVRGAYCGAIGFVDATERTARLAVGIRSFSIVDDAVLFGTGAGITWGSDPEAEWRETELKAATLIGLAAQST